MKTMLSAFLLALALLLLVETRIRRLFPAHGIRTQLPIQDGWAAFYFAEASAVFVVAVITGRHWTYAAEVFGFAAVVILQMTCSARRLLRSHTVQLRGRMLFFFAVALSVAALALDWQF